MSKSEGICVPLGYSTLLIRCSTFITNSQQTAFGIELAPVPLLERTVVVSEGVESQNEHQERIRWLYGTIFFFRKRKHLQLSRKDPLQ